MGWRGLFMRQIRKAARWLADFIEVYLPIAVFVMLFIAFLINVFFRYVVKNPQNWTFELSVNAFVVVGLLGACAAYRKEDHVVFDLLYTRLNSKGQNILRIISYIIVIIFFLIAIPGSIRYLVKLPAVTSIMRIPLRFIFVSFPILMISTVLRSAYRLVLDIKAFRNKTYVQVYNTGDRNALI
jgi:TRAP-type C4-dicarboxylate transport system permease small subunit